MRAAPPSRWLAPALLAAAAALPVAGQDAAEPPAQAAPVAPAPVQAAALPVLTLDRERLFSGTRFGQAVIARFEAEAKALQAENRRIDAALEAEERSLTDRRATETPENFRALAAEFDTKVEKLRAAQETKSRDLTRQRDEARQQFYDTALPVLGRLMSDLGAVAIIDRGALIISLERFDITDEAIARIDQVLGDGSTLPVAPDPTAPDPAGADPKEPDLTGPDLTGPDPTGPDPTEPDPTVLGPADQAPAEPAPADQATKP